MWEQFNLVERFSYSKFSAGALWWWAFTSAIAENEEESRADRHCEDKDDEVGNHAFQNGDEKGKEDCDKTNVLNKMRVNMARIVNLGCAKTERLWKKDFDVEDCEEKNKDCDNESGLRIVMLKTVSLSVRKKKGLWRRIVQMCKDCEQQIRIVTMNLANTCNESLKWRQACPSIKQEPN